MNSKNYSNKKHQYVYMIKTREFLYMNIYKIGRTEQTMDKRMAGYPKGSKQIIIRSVFDCITVERALIKKFKKKFKQKKKLIGNEYFQGNETEMINVFNDVVNQYNRKYKNNIIPLEVKLKELDKFKFVPSFI